MLALCAQAKDEGNKCYKSDKFERAVAFYRMGLSKLRIARARNLPDADTHAQGAGELEVTLHQNTAMCQVKTAHWEEAISACGHALRLDPHSTKARLFRARAFAAASHRADGLSRARDDLVAALAGYFCPPHALAHGDSLDSARR